MAKIQKNEYSFKVIGHIRSDFPEKFGIPRQSGRVPSLGSTVIFEPEYRNPDALRELDGFSHIWILWVFSESVTEKPPMTVRPPRLGGNRQVGVFASRSPFRPNPIGISAVKLEEIVCTEKYGQVLRISGADMMDGTPIIDIKPYLPSADLIENAVGGYADGVNDHRLNVKFICEIPDSLAPDRRISLSGILADDPRPSYQNTPDRVYMMDFAGHSVGFRVDGDNLYVVRIEKI